MPLLLGWMGWLGRRLEGWFGLVGNWVGLWDPFKGSSGCIDSSPFATARWELWEECGVWLTWRQNEEFEWIYPKQGHPDAFVYTRLRDNDEIKVRPNVEWMTVGEFSKASGRQDQKKTAADSR